jgi:hypothetical protein
MTEARTGQIRVVNLTPRGRQRAAQLTGSWAPGSNATKTYGKVHGQGEAFPTTCLFGKV